MSSDRDQGKSYSVAIHIWVGPTPFVLNQELKVDNAHLTTKLRNMVMN
jgi:hypothetical protein